MVPADGHGPVIDMDQPPDDRQFTLPWRRIGLVLAVLALAAGAYAATHGGGPPAPRPAGAPKPPVTAESLEPAGECAGMPDGTVIQVGHGFANRAGSPVTAESVTLTATQPLRALRLRDEGRGQCGLPTATGAIVVQPGGTFNFTATFDLPATCPAVTELKFTVRWRADGADYSTPIDLAYLITELVPACHKSVPAAPVAPGSGR